MDPKKLDKGDKFIYIYFFILTLKNCIVWCIMNIVANVDVQNTYYQTY